MSEDTKAIIVVLLLIFVFPIGLLLMWFWTKWPLWVKLVVTIPILLIGLLFLGIFSAALITTINPTQQIARAHDATRKNDVAQLLNAVLKYEIDNSTLPAGITTTEKEISKTEADICSALVPKYLNALPKDPKINNGESISDCNSTYNTGYSVVLDQNGKDFIIKAPLCEGSEETKCPISYSSAQ